MSNSSFAIFNMGIGAACLALASIAAVPAKVALGQDSGGMQLDEARTGAVIEKTLELLNARYVFPEVAEAMAKHVRANVEKGAYASLSSPGALAYKLTEDLQSVSNDLHLRVSFAPGVDMHAERDDTGANEEAAARAKKLNYGFESVTRLAGNVGFVDLRNFHSKDIGAETASAAMNFLAHTDALIFDLRQNGGGDPEMVAWLSSYLFGDKPVHLNSLYWREGETTQEFWTDPKVPGKRSADSPVFVLTSGRTFSAAEEFSYNLKCLGRTLIVGEKTGGGAHPGGRVPVDEDFAVWIPMGRAINPITGTNWEGTGVEPDIAVPVNVAKEMAHMLALEGMLATVSEDWRLEELERELAAVRGRIDKLAGGR